MAPHPLPQEGPNPNPPPPPSTPSPSPTATGHTNNQNTNNTLSTASIVGMSVFGFFFICSIIYMTAFLLHRRAERKKLPESHRRASTYHPFRTASTASKNNTTTTDKSGLLANEQEVPESAATTTDDKSSMFSRDSRHGSVHLYLPLDEEVDTRRKSMETVNLIPLHITPPAVVEEAARPPLSVHPSVRTLAGSESGRETTSSSNGSGVSKRSGSGSMGSSARLSVNGRGRMGADEEDADLGTRKVARPRSLSASRYYDPTARTEAPAVPALPGSESR